MIRHPQGLEGLAETIRFTRNILVQTNGFSLVSEQDGQIVLDRLREWIGGPLTDFIDEYASGLTESILRLIASNDLDDADIVAAEALSELAEQLCLAYADRPQKDYSYNTPMAAAA